jgi:hypothetical protein
MIASQNLEVIFLRCSFRCYRFYLFIKYLGDLITSKLDEVGNKKLIFSFSQTTLGSNLS